MADSSSACLKDSDALVGFQNALAFFSGSVERALDAVSDYVGDVHAEMERHIALLEEAVRQAKEAVEAAKAAVDAAESDLQNARYARESANEALQEAIREEEEMESWNAMDDCDPYGGFDSDY